MVGMFVVHPRVPPADRGVTATSRSCCTSGTSTRGPAAPEPHYAMTDFNVLTINGKAFPGTEPLVASAVTGCASASATWADGPPPDPPPWPRLQVMETDGGPFRPRPQWPETTVLVPVGSTRVIEFVADAPGDWADALPHDPPHDEPDGTRRPQHDGSGAPEPSMRRSGRCCPVT